MIILGCMAVITACGKKRTLPDNRHPDPVAPSNAALTVAVQVVDIHSSATNTYFLTGSKAVRIYGLFFTGAPDGGGQHVITARRDENCVTIEENMGSSRQGHTQTDRKQYIYPLEPHVYSLALQPINVQLTIEIGPNKVLDTTSQ